MKAFGIVLIVLGVVMLASAGMRVEKAPNVSYLIGTFLPGLFALIIGLKLAQTKKPATPPPLPDDEEDDEDDDRPAPRRKKAD